MNAEHSIDKVEEGLSYEIQRTTHTRPVLIACIVTALVAGPIIVLQRVWPDLPWLFTLVLCFLIALEGVLTVRWLDRPKQFRNKLGIYVAEVIVALFVIRIATWIVNGGFPSRSEFFHMLTNPEAVLDGFFVVTAALAIFALLRAQSQTRLFTKFSLDRSELVYLSPIGLGDSAREDHAPPVTDRHALLLRFYRGWAISGLILIVCAALSTYDLSAIGGRTPGISSIRDLDHLGLPREMLIAMLVYFLGGLWLASEGRLAMLNARWVSEGIHIENKVSLSWRRYSLILLGLIAVVAALLPLGTTIGLTELFEAIAWIGYLVAGLLIAILSAIYLLILSGLLSVTRSDPQPPVELSEIVPEIPQLAAPPSQVASLVMGIIFWIVLLAVVLLAILYSVRQRGAKPSRRGFIRLWRSFWAWLASFWHKLSDQASSIRTVIGSKVSKLEQTDLPGFAQWRFIRINSLSPRNKIRYFYLSTVRRAGDRGVHRDNAETPSEYARDLRDNWPVVADELDELTAAFIRARYSKQPIEEPDASSARSIWRRIRTVLRRRFRR